jgi:hypothetical protein
VLAWKAPLQPRNCWQAIAVLRQHCGYLTAHRIVSRGNSAAIWFEVDGAKVRKLTHGLCCRFLKCLAQLGDVAAIEERVRLDIGDAATFALRRQRKPGIHRSAAIRAAIKPTDCLTQKLALP